MQPRLGTGLGIRADASRVSDARKGTAARWRRHCGLQLGHRAVAPWPTYLDLLLLAGNAAGLCLGVGFAALVLADLGRRVVDEGQHLELRLRRGGGRPGGRRGGAGRDRGRGRGRGRRGGDLPRGPAPGGELCRGGVRRVGSVRPGVRRGHVSMRGRLGSGSGSEALVSSGAPGGSPWFVACAGSIKPRAGGRVARRGKRRCNARQASGRARAEEGWPGWGNQCSQRSMVGRDGQSAHRRQITVRAGAHSLGPVGQRTGDRRPAAKSCRGKRPGPTASFRKPAPPTCEDYPSTESATESDATRGCQADMRKQEHLGFSWTAITMRL